MDSHEVLTQCEPGFESIVRYWDRRMNLPIAKIHPGDFYVTRKQEAIVTVLGSCVSACIRDPNNNVGGMNHFMLPGSEKNIDLDNSHGPSDATRYGSYAMEKLINQIIKMGGLKTRLEVKLFGGGRIISGLSNVGDNNVTFVRQFMSTEGLTIKAEDLLGDHPRKIIYEPFTGKVLVRRLRKMDERILLDEEKRYSGKITVEKVGGDVELFD